MAKTGVAYGKTVWSWHPLLMSSCAEAKSAQPGSINLQSANDGDKTNSSPGRARHKPSSHCAGNAGLPPLNLYARVRFFAQSCTRDRGCSAHPAFPAPSVLEGGNVPAKLGRNPPRDREGLSANVSSRLSNEWYARDVQIALGPSPLSAKLFAVNSPNESDRMSGQDSSDWLGLSGRVCVVTGGGGGIGRATAVNLARAGAHVAALGRDESGLAVTEAELKKIGHAHVITRCDTKDIESVAAAAETVEKSLGPCSVLVNAAGVLRRGGLDTLPLAEWNEVMAVNLTGYFLCAQMFGRSM